MAKGRRKPLLQYLSRRAGWWPLPPAAPDNRRSDGLGLASLAFRFMCSCRPLQVGVQAASRFASEWSACGGPTLQPRGVNWGAGTFWLALGKKETQKP